MPKEIHGLKGSCLVIPCSFSYTSYPPNRPDRVVWYQWVSEGYPLVYDPEHPSNVIDKFKGNTFLFGDPKNRKCSLLIINLNQSHHGEKLYAWIDPDSVRNNTYRFFDVTSTILVDVYPKPPTINIYGGERTGDDMIVACHTYHSCPYRQPHIILNGIEGYNKTIYYHIEDGLWKITQIYKGVVKVENSDIECTVKHYGGIRARATKNKSSASDRVYEADVVPRLTALPHSCVVIPCSFKMHEELDVNLRVRESSGLDGGSLCVSCEIKEAPDKPVMSPIPDNIEPGTNVTIECSVKHTCPSHPPSITWSVPTAGETVKHQRMGEGVWETVSTVTFLPTACEEEVQIICNAAFWGDRTVVNSSTELRVQRIQRVGVKIFYPFIVPSSLNRKTFAVEEYKLEALSRTNLVVHWLAI
ncbi:Sialoadhesin Sheep erythrocyte receptor [Triplophysa tibetana]|uniref:Sialoadhesin Sheep erythrocyte receptor n=1 Tax=Triplophysa tibetana TaxID=1572043 RepID=A0A5A9MY75_9TELE|nr:Sialoadhesin Sheep erythrocyte receptor [Triplophysa tibetana]